MAMRRRRGGEAWAFAEADRDLFLAVRFGGLI